MAKKNTAGTVQGRHIRLAYDMLNCPAWAALSTTARALFVDMRAPMTSTNNGNLSATFSELKHRGWRSEHTLARALRELEALGFIRKTRQTVGVEKGSKVCNLYRFTDIEAFARPKPSIEASPATREYMQFKARKKAEQVAAEAREPQRRKKRTLQKVHRDAAQTAPMGEIDAAVSAVGLKVGTKSPATKSKAKPPATRMDTGLASNCPKSNAEKSNCRNCTPYINTTPNGADKAGIEHAESSKWSKPTNWILAGLAHNRIQRLAVVKRLAAKRGVELGQSVGTLQ